VGKLRRMALTFLFDGPEQAKHTILLAHGAGAMSHLMLKSAKRASLIENLRSLRGFDKMLVR